MPKALKCAKTLKPCRADYPAWVLKLHADGFFFVKKSPENLHMCIFCCIFAAETVFGSRARSVLGELISGKHFSEALRAGWGSFVGILFGTILKLIACGLMTVALIQALVA